MNNILWIILGIISLALVFIFGFFAKKASDNDSRVAAISLCIVLPMALSGFLLERLDFKLFFMLDTLCAPITWVAILCLTNMHKILQHKDDRRLKVKSQG